jgi:hypothetical protein
MTPSASLAAAGSRLPADVPESVEDYAHDLADAVAAAIPGWVTGCIERVMAAQSLALTPEVRRAAAEAASRAQSETGTAIRALLAADIDEQRSTPLTLLRQAVRYPTRVLEAAGATPVRRDRFAERTFPDDIYDLAPASLADVDPALTNPGMAWGAAKAFEHKRRHRTPGSGPRGDPDSAG